MLKYLKIKLYAKELSLSVSVSNKIKSTNRSQVDENPYRGAALIAQNSFKNKI